MYKCLKLQYLAVQYCENNKKQKMRFIGKNEKCVYYNYALRRVALSAVRCVNMMRFSLS